MLTFQPEAQALLENYLKQLEYSLRGLPEEEKKDIGLEIKGHICERLAEGTSKVVDGSMLQQVLDGFGAPSEFASLYSDNHVNGKSGSLKTRFWNTCRIIQTSIAQFVILFPAIISYIVAFAVITCSVIKLAFPQHFQLFQYVHKADTGELAGFLILSTNSPSEGLKYQSMFVFDAAVPSLIAGIFLVVLAMWVMRKLTRFSMLRQNNLEIYV